jgi:hypothetical protein
MKGIYKIITAVLFVVWLAVIWKAPTILSPKGVALSTEEDTSALSSEGNPAAPQNGRSEQGKEGISYLDIIDRLKSPFPASRYEGLITRNIFLRPEKPRSVLTPESLTLLSVQPVRLPFFYNGFIQTPDGAIIGQITWSDKTYFVRKSGKFKDYKVIDIDKTVMIVEDKDRQRMVLDYKKPVKGTELVAKLYNPMEDKTYEVRKEDYISEFKILDIKTDSVILYEQNKQWIINKER